MANTLGHIYTIPSLELTLARLEKTVASQVAPSASGYVVSVGSLPWQRVITMPEALGGVYWIGLENGDGITQAQGWIRIAADDAGPYVAEQSLQVIQNQVAIEALQASVDAIAADLQLVQDKTDLIGSGTATINRVVSDQGQITDPIVIGDDYLATHDRAFQWTVDPLPGVSVGSATCKFGGHNPTEGSWNIDGTVSAVTVSGETKWQLSFDMTKAVSGTLGEGVYDWSVEVRDGSSNEVTRVRNANHDYRVAAVAKQT